MDKRAFKGNLLLFCAALVWGATFVAQRRAMDHMGPLTFSGLRFLIGVICLAPLAAFSLSRPPRAGLLKAPSWMPLAGSLALGILMAVGINLQQVGLVTTTAGNAGFITGLYVVIVPFLGLALGFRPLAMVWVGAGLGVAGLYFLSATDSFRLSPGDGWVLACAFAWAVHVVALSWFSPRVGSYVLALGQAFVCAAISLALAFPLEKILWNEVLAAWPYLAFGGVGSVAVGFTLQVVGQKDTTPTQAAVILQFEAVTAAFAGWLLLDEPMNGRKILGAGLMFAGMLLAQLAPLFKKSTS